VSARKPYWYVTSAVGIIGAFWKTKTDKQANISLALLSVWMINLL
jgi:hypothetical protein